MHVYIRFCVGVDEGIQNALSNDSPNSRIMLVELNHVHLLSEILASK